MPTKYWPVEAEAEATEEVEAAEDGSEEAAAEEVVAAVVELIVVVVVNMHGACIVALFKGKNDKCE